MQTTEPILTYAEISLDAIAYNIRQIRKLIGPKIELFAVVKANAYGHGALQISKTALQNGATRLAVNRVLEGEDLRKKGICAPILILGYCLQQDANTIVNHDLTASVQNVETVRAISECAQKLNKIASIHLKIDTGMGRYGILPKDILSFLESIRSFPAINIEGIFTHFSSSSANDKTYTFKQYNTFLNVIEVCKKAGFEFNIRHAANSAATLDLPEVYLDGVRTGIAMYGLNPFDDKVPEIDLHPALTFKSHIARIQTLPKDSSISYGRTYITEKETTVALIPVGYGDGYHRIFSNQGKVLIHGKPAPILGRVCMDQFVVNISHIEGVNQDDEVVLIGEQNGNSLTAEELASIAQTINYEITTGLLPRVPRVYIQNGQVIEIETLH